MRDAGVDQRSLSLCLYLALSRSLPLSLPLCINIYIYIYIYIYTYIYIYIGWESAEVGLEVQVGACGMQAMMSALRDAPPG